MTGYTDKRHIARATIEAACYQTQAVLAACEKDSGVPLASLQVDGGMTKCVVVRRVGWQLKRLTALSRSSDIIMQIQADILGLTVERPEMRE
jgi:glycerol kinase